MLHVFGGDLQALETPYFRAGLGFAKLLGEFRIAQSRAANGVGRAADVARRQLRRPPDDRISQISFFLVSVRMGGLPRGNGSSLEISPGSLGISSLFSLMVIYPHWFDRRIV